MSAEPGGIIVFRREPSAGFVCVGTARGAKDCESFIALVSLARAAPSLHREKLPKGRRFAAFVLRVTTPPQVCVVRYGSSLTRRRISCRQWGDSAQRCLSRCYDP